MIFKMYGWKRNYGDYEGYKSSYSYGGVMVEIMLTEKASIMRNGMSAPKAIIN